MPYLSELQCYWEEGQNPKQLLTSFEEIQKTLYSNGIRKQYRNYPSLGFQEWHTAYYGDNYERLSKLKAKYDPDNLFSHEQTINA